MSKIETPHYRDTVFRLLYNNKKELLKLYNALNGTSYTNEDDLIVNTLKDSQFMKVKNDVSFVFSCELNVFEHQSTLCPNMPLRDLFYVAKLLRKITSDDDLYSGKLIKIPAPRFYVFYNGTSPMPDRQVFRLSDQFEKTIEKPDLELAVTVLNINDGHNTELMKSCSTLKEYSIFVALVRQYTKEIPKDADDKNEAIKAAISKAIDKCVADGILSDFLTQHREKVMEVCMWDYNEQLHEKTIQTESYDKALADVFKVMLSNGYSLEDTKKIEDALKKSHETSSSN